MYNDLPNEASPTSAPADRIGHESRQPHEPGGLSLIDYEYAGYNPRGFDVGNHFCEWMADYATAEPHVLDLDKYPSVEERRRFCAAYLVAMNGVGNFTTARSLTHARFDTNILFFFFLP